MAEHSTPEERTEAPTDRRLGQLRKEGSIHMSMELVNTISLLTGFLIVGLIFPQMYENLKGVFRISFGMMATPSGDFLSTLKQGCTNILLLVGPHILLITVVIAIFSALAVMLQTNWNIKEKKIHFQFHYLNPINGVKRIFSLNGFVNILKALVKLAIILPIGYFSLKAYAPKMIQLIHMNLNQIFVFTGEAMRSIFWKIFYIMVAISLFDFLYGRWQWMRQNRMTKDEVKDERKSIEGDEASRREFRRKGMQRILQRLRETVPKADVVVTNPTHYAVALKYDRETMSAPTVVAKGKDFLAQRIKELARESGVPVLERKVLARALYSSTEVGTSIPRDLFKAVAEVLAYVYRLKNPFKYRNQGATR